MGFADWGYTTPVYAIHGQLFEKFDTYSWDQVSIMEHRFSYRYRLAELVDAIVRRNVSILCVQETKWVCEKVRIIEPWGYKLQYTGRDRNRNMVGVIIDKQLLEDVVEVRRKGDKILLLKLILGREIFNVISIYAPQVGLNESSKRQFWEDLDEIL